MISGSFWLPEMGFRRGLKILLVAGVVTVLSFIFAGSELAVAFQTGSQRGSSSKPAGSSTRPSTSAQSKSTGLGSVTLDELVAKELQQLGLEPGPPLSDEEFLRRVYLDVVGHIPPADRVLEFTKDSHPRKRNRLIRELLDGPEFPRHWARYWTDVITIRTRDEDDHLEPAILEDWFARQIAKNTPWNEVVRQLITATGRNDEDGPANFILTQMARPEDLAAETSRVFLGIQLQCAQCHDDPSGTWTRQQFHEFAAFFGRLDEEGVPLRPEPDLPPGVKAPPPPFRVLVLDTARKEYMMPDKEDASKTTMLLQPRALSGPALPRGATDAQRREFLAGWVTGTHNMWFPRAYVNRIWSHLMGDGFTKVVDDMGRDRPVLCPTVLYRVSAAWRTGGYDPHWLMELILNSQTYQRKSAGASNSELAHFAGVPQTRLQASQVLSSLAVALGFDVRKLPTAFRTQFMQTFEFDPSTPADQVVSTISQSLLMMNDPVVLQSIQHQTESMVAKLAEDADDAAVIESLYVRTLSRRPSPDELRECQSYLAEIGNRHEAFEDLLWCLVNSTEFLTKR